MKQTRLRTLGPLATVLLLYSLGMEAQEAREVTVDPASEIAFMSWLDLADGQPLDDPRKQLVIVEAPSFGDLEPGADGLTYFPGDQLWSTRGDTFTYYFADAAAAVATRLVSSPFEYQFADDMESGDATAWSAAAGAVSFVDTGLHGRGLEIVATSTEDVYLERGGVPWHKGEPDQETKTVMTVELDDPPRLYLTDGELVVWKAVDSAGQGARLRLRRLSGIFSARAESCLLDAVACGTEWLDLVDQITRITVVYTTYSGGSGSLDLFVGGSESFLPSADGVSSPVVEHRLGALSVTGLDGLRIRFDDFATGASVRGEPRAVRVDSFEEAAFAAGWDLSESAGCALDAAAALSGDQGLAIDLDQTAAAGNGESGLRLDLAEPTASLTTKMQIDATALVVHEGWEVALLQASADELFSPTDRLAQLYLRFTGGTFQVLAGTRDSYGTEVRTSWWPLAPGPHGLAVSWRAGLLGGELGLWVDGQPVARRRGFSTSGQTLTALRVGTYGVGTEPAKGSGRLAIDSFAAWY